MTIHLANWMLDHNHVAHSRDLITAGYTRHQIRRAVDAGHLERVRRSWLVTRRCTMEHRAAAEVSGRVTCVTAAKRLGLWQGATAEVHLAVPATSSRIVSAGNVLHWGAGPVPVARFTVDDAVLNVLFHTARCCDRDDAVAIWEAALRKKVVTLAQLRRTAWHSTKADEVLSLVGTLSDSYLETRFLAIMRSCGLEVRQQMLIDGHPVDALIGERLIIQLDGFEFHGEAKDRRKDLRQDARLVLLGYTVLRFDYQQVLFDHEYVQETILNAIAQGLYLATRR
jgi:very-short-patch-repair endonuclease